MHGQARTDPVAVARAVVIRRNGTREVHYSVPRLPFWHLRQRLKLWRHLRFMKAEDKEAGL